MIRSRGKDIDQDLAIRYQFPSSKQETTVVQYNVYYLPRTRTETAIAAIAAGAVSGCPSGANLAHWQLSPRCSGPHTHRKPGRRLWQDPS